MRKIIFISIMFLFGVVSPVYAVSGKSKILVKYTGTQPIAAYFFKLTPPVGVSLASDSVCANLQGGGNYIAVNTSSNTVVALVDDGKGFASGISAPADLFKCSFTVGSTVASTPAATDYVVSSAVRSDPDGNSYSMTGNEYQVVILPNDVTSPSVTISSVIDGSVLNSVLSISGSAADTANAADPAGVVTGVIKVMVQITDGTYYVDASQALVTTPTWILANGTTSWSLNTSLVNWITEKNYTVTAKSFDGEDNTTLSAPVTFTFYNGSQAYSNLTLELTSSAILQNGTLGFAGKLSRLPASSLDLSGLPITLSVTAPDLSVKKYPIKTYSTLGDYKLEGITDFTQKGRYTIEATYGGSLALSSSKVMQGILVGSSPGYAIIVEGKIDNSEGLASHNKTTNRIYQKLLDRGFLPDNILYFNYDKTQPGFYAVPTKSNVKGAIVDWAKTKMNAVAAPLYLVMVDHGNVNKFYLNTEHIAPDELDGWIKTLEAGLNATAATEKKVIVLGACYSGSFLPSLSNQNRVVVSSASANEESFKGSMEPDGIRVGEFFLEELFREWGRGDSLKGAYTKAVLSTSIYTRKGDLSPNSTNSTGAYQDDAMQHPLLDDNGDKAGSRYLNGENSDGQQAGGIYLGTGSSNSVASPADLYMVTETKYLDSDTSMTTLWAKSEDDTQVSSAWVEVRPPAKTLSSSGGSVQLEVSFTRSWLNYVSNSKDWEASIGGFNVAGRYEVFYFARDIVTGNISPMKRSLVYKDKTGNTAPSPFSLISPTDQSKSKTVAVFSWNSSVDPDGLTYNLIVAADNAFKSVIYHQEGIQTSQAFVDDTVALADLTTYYWKIQAVDAFGKVTESDEIWSFKTDNTNGIPGIIRGIVRSDVDFSLIAGASIKLNNTQVQTNIDGSFILLSDAGTVTLSGSRAGFKDNSVTSLNVVSGKSNQIDVTLHSLTPADKTSTPTTSTLTPTTSTSTSTPTAPSVPGDVAPLGNPNGEIDIGDAVVAARMVAGLIPSDAKADVAPLGKPNGVVDIGDAVVMARAVAGLVTITVDGTSLK